MPLVALDKETRQRVDITKIPDPRGTLTANQLICPLCETEMIIVAGPIKMHHFRHKVECRSDYGRHPESYNHLRTKAIIAERVTEWMKEFTRAKGELEVPIPEVNRVVDVLFTFPNGWRVAHEIQLSAITIEELESRTNDYLKAGIDVFWWLGENADTVPNREWCTEKFGFVLRLEYTNDQTATYLAEEIAL
jgi:competence protein CoiA